ncbi:MAG: hypothetical protein HZA93_27940 [Verrucomicrobia bacterium]|nr:hypothetical protein [Verrucomicrobiota bacterium]
MKKWMYVIFPAVMLAGFLVIYFTHAKESEAREAQHAKRIADEQAAVAKKKKEAEDKAAKDAKDRQEANAKEMADKEAARIAKQAAADKEVRDQTDAFLTRIDKASKDVAKLEIDLDAIRKEKDKLSRESFDAAKKVELARIAKRTAELEIQRMTDMVQKRTQESFLLRLPPPPPPPPAQAAQKR